MKITCKEATHICDKSQYKEASFWEILKLKIHHLSCKTCLKHAKRNSTLSKLCSNANLQVLDQETKEEMKKKINDQI